MAKRKRKGSRRSRGRGKRKGIKSVPKTVGGVWRAQPLLVKGGMVLTGLELAMGTSNPYGQSVADTAFATGATMQNRIKGTSNVLKANAMQLSTYKPLAYSVIAHYVAKKMKIKGL